MLQEFFYNLFTIFIDMSFYIMLGLLIVGVLNAFINKKWITKQIGDDSFGSVVKASVIGVPLPLCSCGVVPMAVELKKSGASNGAVTSFLISTPQTGVDSIVATYGMMGPVMAIFRPIAAFISGIVGGFFVNLFGRHEKISTGEVKPCCNDHDHPVVEDDHQQEVRCESVCSENESAQTCCCHEQVPQKPTFLAKIKSIFTYAFGGFLDDIAIHFVIGVVISAVISTIIPNDFFASFGLDRGILSMLLMVAIGIPMYICSTSSIPIALTLMMKGLSPGAAFVFLFTGPVTNMASLMVLSKTLGKKIMAIYIASVVVMSLAFGYVFDFIADIWNLSFTSHTMSHAGHEAGVSIWIYIVAVIFFLLLMKSFIVLGMKKFKKK